MAMTRRDFITRLMGGAAAVALSPLLDLAPIEVAPSTLAFSFSPQQLYWLSQRGPMVLYGGAVGGGKTAALRYLNRALYLDGKGHASPEVDWPDDPDY